MEHIVDVTVASGDEETIIVPDGVSAQSYRIVGAISGNPVVGKTAQLLSEDGAIVLQTQTTDADGRATFTDVIYGNYKVKTVY